MNEGGRSALGLRGGVISMNTGKEVTAVPRGTGRKVWLCALWVLVLRLTDLGLF